MFYSISDTDDSEEKNPSSPNKSRIYDLLVTSPDALPLSYRRLAGERKEKEEKKEAYFLSDVLLSELRAILLG